METAKPQPNERSERRRRNIAATDNEYGYRNPMQRIPTGEKKRTPRQKHYKERNRKPRECRSRTEQLSETGNPEQAQGRATSVKKESRGQREDRTDQSQLQGKKGKINCRRAEGQTTEREEMQKEERRLNKK